MSALAHKLRNFQLVGGLLATMALTIPASAQTWKTTGTAGGNWNTPAKWTPTGVPTSSYSTSLTFTSTILTGAYTATDNIAGTFELNAITFNTGIIGTGITIAASGGSQLSFGGTNASITNTSTSLLKAAATISAPVVLAGDTTVNGGGLGVVFSGGVSGSGGMTINGTVTFTGSTASTYSGATLVNGQLVEDATNVLSANSDVTVTGTMGVNGQQNIGALNGNGTVRAQLLTGADTLSVGNDNASGEFDGVISDGLLTNTLALDKEGSGTEALTGTNTYTGGTTLGGGTLAVGNDSALGTGNITVTGNGTTLSTTGGAVEVTLANNVTLQQNLAYTISSAQPALNVTGVISDTSGQGITKNGDGILILSGNNTYTGGTTLNSGYLELASATALGTGNVVVTGGELSLVTLAPTTTINVGGNYTQSGGTLRLALLSPSTNELLNVTGNVSLSGGTVNLALDGGPITIANGTVLTLVQATGTVSGKFSGSTVDSGITLPGVQILTYTTNDVYLGFYNYISSIPGLTPNQRAVANYIDEHAGAPTGNFKTLVDNIYPLNGNVQALGSALDQLSPQSLQVWRHVSFDNATFSSLLVNNHLANLRDGMSGFDGSQFTYNDTTLGAPLSSIKNRLLAWDPNVTPGLVSDTVDPVIGGVDLAAPRGASAPTNPWSTFIAGNVVFADLDPNQDLAFQHYTTGAVTAGADYQLDDHWTVGGLFGYGHTSATLDNIGSQTTVDTYSPAVYASYVDGGWYGNGLFSYGYNKYAENRNVQIGTLNGSNTGSPSGSQYVANLTGGYEFKEGLWRVGPMASAQFVHLGIDSYVEQGPTALNIQQQTDESFRTQFGFTARYEGHVEGWFGSFKLVPHLSAAWQHEYLDNSLGITSQFNQVGAGSFTVQASEPDRDSAVIDAGIDAEIEKELTLFIDYQTQVGQADFFANSIQGGIKVAF
jgi:autotransporter-associated beta strand protein